MYTKSIYRQQSIHLYLNQQQMGKDIELTARYKQEKVFSKDTPIFSNKYEKDRYIKQAIEEEPNEDIKKLLKKQLYY